MKSLEKYLFGNEQPGLRSASLLAAIAKLPEENQKVIRLHFLDKIPRKEIARQLNWSDTKVHNKITRGITLLKQELNPAYFEEMVQLRAIASS